MPLKDSLLLKHMGLSHGLRDLGILNQYCNTYLNTLDKKIPNCHNQVVYNFVMPSKGTSLYLISYGLKRKFIVKPHGMAV